MAFTTRVGENTWAKLYWQAHRMASTRCIGTRKEVRIRTITFELEERKYVNHYMIEFVGSVKELSDFHASASRLKLISAM